jgi:hypothetical protein
MTIHPTSKVPFTAGGLAELSSNAMPGVMRAQARSRDRAFQGELEPVQDPDGEAGRGRLGHAY